MPALTINDRSVTEDLQAYLKEMSMSFLRIQLEPIIKLIGILEKARGERKTIFVFGNGGSAATASHFANDLAKGTIVGYKPRFRVISLNDNVPLMTAWANDTDYEKIFAEQLENLVEEGDIVIAISTSGNSKNILKAVECARRAGALTIGLTGAHGGELRRFSDFTITVPSDDVGQIEGLHSVLCHLVTSNLVRVVNDAIR